MKNKETETVEEVKANMAKASQEAAQEPDKVSIDLDSPKSEPEAPKESLSVRLGKAYEDLNETDRKAWNQGWRPEEFFGKKRRDGSTKEWINAEEFLGKTKEVLPVANERIKDLTKQIEEAKLQASKVEQRMLEAEEKGYNRALKEVQTKQLEAVEVGDTEVYKALKVEEMELIKDKYTPTPAEIVKKVEPIPEVQPKQQETRTPEEDKVLQTWVASNTWFHKPEHRPMANYAIAFDSKLKTDKPYLSVEERLNIVNHELASIPTFASVVNPSSSNKFNLGDGGDNASVFGDTPKPKGYNNLSDSDKATCERVARLRGYAGDQLVTFRTNFSKEIYKNINN